MDNVSDGLRPRGIEGLWFAAPSIMLALKRLTAVVLITIAMLLGTTGMSAAEKSYLEASRYLHVIRNKIDDETLSYPVESPKSDYRLPFGMARTFANILPEQSIQNVYKTMFPLEVGKSIIYR